MTRKLKAFSLAVFAAFAMSAVAASAASAEDLFHSEASHTILDASAEGNQVFVTPSGNVTCKKVSVHNSTLSANTVTSIKATPTYTECTATVGGAEVAAEVEFTSCFYEFTSHKKASGHSDAHVGCGTAGDKIHITAFVLGAYRRCYSLPAQTPTAKGVTYANLGSGATREVTINATVEGITYTKEGVCGSGHANDATYNGAVKVKGTNTAEGHVGIWWGT